MFLHLICTHVLRFLFSTLKNVLKRFVHTIKHLFFFLLNFKQTKNIRWFREKMSKHKIKTNFHRLAKSVPKKVYKKGFKRELR